MRTVFRISTIAVVFLLLFMVLASPALAQGNGNNNQGGNNQGNNNQGNDNQGGGKDRVPEIDPGSAMSGLILLAGGMLLLADSRRRKR